MTRLLEVLSSVYSESLKSLPKGNSEFKHILRIDDGLYAIVQRYNTTEDNHFWEVHFDFYDIHIFISGEELISLSNELRGDEDLVEEKSDFYLVNSKLNALSKIKMSETGILVIPPLTPHKCVQKFNQSYITKITIKVDKRKFAELLASVS